MYYTNIADYEKIAGNQPVIPGQRTPSTVFLITLLIIIGSFSASAILIANSFQIIPENTQNSTRLTFSTAVAEYNSAKRNAQKIHIRISLRN